MTDISPEYAETAIQISRQNTVESGLSNPWEIYSDGIRRIWFITLSSGAVIKRVKIRLPVLLETMERAGDTFVQAHRGEDLANSKVASVTELLEIGVVEICSRAPRRDDTGPHKDGVALLYPDGIGGPSEVTWGEFNNSLATLISSAVVKRKVATLRANNSDERHLFIGISYTSAWPLFHSLSMDVRTVPPDLPDVPDILTHLWLMSAGIAGRCLVWSRMDEWCGHAGPTWLDAARHWATP